METTQLKGKHQIAEGPSQSAEYQALLPAGPRLRLLQQAHAHLVVTGCHRSRALLTRLIILACTAGSITYTRRLFSSVVDPDSFLFNSLIKASSKFGFPLDAIIFYRHMLLAGIPPSTYTFTSVIKACADLSASRAGIAIHTHVFVNGHETDSFVQSALVTFYAKSSNLGIARSVFDKMPDRTIVAWNSMISGCEQNGLPKEALELFHEMSAKNMNPDSATLASVLAACSQLGSLNLGIWVHDYIISNNMNLGA
ncbi:hypothetical protein K1719_007661 [Acacia pycnantha]|nr:hypothetical protein K1719_007661 [Acacia pycnantha]